MLKNNEDKLSAQVALVDVLEDYEKDDSVTKHDLEVAKTVLSALGEILIDADNLDWNRKQVEIRKQGGKTSWDDTYPDQTVSIRIKNKEVKGGHITSYYDKHNKDDVVQDFPTYSYIPNKSTRTQNAEIKHPPYKDHLGVTIKPGDTVVMYVELGLDSWNFVVKVDENYTFKNDNISFDISRVDTSRVIVDNNLSYDSKKMYLTQYDSKEINDYYNKK